MLTLGAPLGAPGKDKIVHRGVDENGRQWAVAQLKRLGAGAVRKLTAEVSFLRRAAAAGLAPQVSTELSDLPKGRLVTELCDGGTLKDVLRRQDGALRRDQQQRLVEILEALGGPSCAMCHGDLGNPLNYVEGKDGVLRVIDFASRTTSPKRTGMLLATARSSTSSRWGASCGDCAPMMTMARRSGSPNLPS